MSAVWGALALASSLLPGLFSEDDIVARFDKGGPHSVSARMIRERARAKGLGRKFGRVRWFTEDEILQMMKAGPARSQSKKWKGSPYFYVRGTVHGQSVYASTKETDKASARRFKDALEIRIARSAGQKCDALTFREATALYLEFRRPQKTNQIDRLCTVIGDRLLTNIRSAALVDAASALYPGCTAATWNRCVFTPAAAILHHAAANDLCPYVRVLNFCSFSIRRAGGFPTHSG